MSKLNLESAFALKGSSLKMPVLGFGVYNSPADVTKASVLAALRAGYRHIDCAQYYENEQQVGEAVREWIAKDGGKREQVFFTTKILSPASSEDETLKSLRQSVDKANLDGYVDCFLIHTPTSGTEGRKHLWNALKKLRDEGKAKVIGVSNYGVKHLEEMVAAGETPAINQIEIHPWCQQKPIVDFCQKHGIVLQAYCPIVRGAYAGDPLLNELADKYKVSWAQVLLRWSLQKGYSPLPKSDTPSRIVSNADLYSFELEQADVDRLDQCDKGAAGAVGPNPVECA
ncbi:related to 2,5-diketo-D-gluconic acid reductase [Pseudozyma flocculosa]|nr:related to 2,5-diketo-D-gluconic acid reductase [Pseudozyma flocculosa]